jgi:hypothetical protein
MATLKQDAWPKRVYRQRKRADRLEVLATIGTFVFGACCLLWGWLIVSMVFSL